MQELFTTLNGQPPLVQALGGVALLLLIAFLVNLALKKIALRMAAPFLDRRTKTPDKAVGWLITAIPLLIISRGIVFVRYLPAEIEAVVANVANATIVLSFALAITTALKYVNEVYNRRPEAKNRPIKGFLQVIKILVYAAATILGIAALIEQSPLLLLSGLGAMAAVLLLVFKDTILSLVASVQLSTNDMLRVGDWIEMPQQNADGDVIDIALHTVKVQNFDKTITTIPTYKLINESFRNWRGMTDAGGRRIKRAIHLDQNTLRFLTDEEVADLRRFRLLRDYLDRKEQELGEWNAREMAGESNPVNARRITNIGTFRAYVTAYLRTHPQIHQDMLTMVRQLEPTPTGLPLQLYTFAATTQFAEYEFIQAEIFDHLLAILPEFGLRLFQEPSGVDFARLSHPRTLKQWERREAVTAPTDGDQDSAV
ncbi:mechanosensitive ion channel family protein [Alteriqipengyuania lutimaris]|uniref:Mechanosensing system component YbdG n=1 Tax=Alteriqipengyuania lutimaris TaxID=1538146 RepID=A0A395LIQ0_9SPHN|nr:mechanosensitive ion channel family protein [Alteriqipengyuania lutimaris]MBB3034591.1 miniconductance mechanosensitive channel [Alteriqipengyuania lutimaris]RDS76529.1 mechanosensitive ion channel family protein [Alteriqipengyuania lutimaris]